MATPKSPAARKPRAREGEALPERVARLADELKLALEFNRPSILLAIYQSYFVMMDAQDALADALHALGQKTERYIVDKDHADIPLRLSEHPQLGQTVFFIQGLQFGGPSALRALNIRREYLVEKSIRAVFWLTEVEATALAHEAPDFWAFRHRTVNFLDAPEPRRVVEMGRGSEARVALKELDGQINLRLKLLADLADDAATWGARAELQTALAGLYSARGDFDAAIPYWQQAIENGEQQGDTGTLALAYGGLGRAYAGLGRFEEALHVLKQAIKVEPRLAANYDSLGNLHLDLGQSREAAEIFRLGAQADPLDSGAHIGLGDVLGGQGRFDEAAAEYTRALEIDPESIAPHLRLGRVYLRQGALDKAAAEFEEAASRDENDWRPIFDLGLLRISQGRTREAQSLWQRGLELCGGNGAVERLNRALYTAALGNSERALVELRSILKSGVPRGLSGALLQDAEIISRAALDGFEDFVELLRESPSHFEGRVKTE